NINFFLPGKVQHDQDTGHSAHGNPRNRLTPNRLPNFFRKIQFVAETAKVASHFCSGSRDLFLQLGVVSSRVSSHSRSFLSSSIVARKSGLFIFICAINNKINAKRKCTAAATSAIKIHETCATIATPKIAAPT